MKYLIIGLGNIGAEYHETRHNIGFMILDALAEKFEISFTQDRYAYITEFKYKGRTIILVKPTTYMNLSGKTVRYWLNQTKIKQENLLVITDDIAIPFGKIRTKKKGSAGGHNGLKNIEELLGTPSYTRMRFGVGDDYSKGKQVDYVLEKFTQNEQIDLDLSLINKAKDAVLAFTTIGADRMMNQYNG